MSILWDWLNSFSPNTQFLLYGDFNMIDQPKDSIGSKNFIHGIEVRAWKDLVDQHNLIDLYISATRLLGPPYTRQMVLSCAPISQG